jgi:NDP-sugar pyrophosphorylase family protein
MYNKTAVILAGGKGTRLRPYTLAMPKPLVPVVDKPILEIVLRQLKNQGFQNINIAVNHQAELIEAYFGDGGKLGLNIRYFLEDKPLGTMGPLTNMDNLPENFIVMNGDVLSDIRFDEFLEYHVDNQALFTISCYEREEKVDYGVLNISGNNLVGFQEKPHVKYDVSMGIYAVNRKILEYIPKNSFFGFDNLMNEMLTRNVPIHTRTYNGYWMDIGRPEDYEQAFNDVESGKLSLF